MTHLTPEQAAEALQVSVITIRRKCAAGEIPGATKATGHWRIPEQGFHQWLESGQVRESPGVAIPQSTGRVSGSRRKFRSLVGGKV